MPADAGRIRRTRTALAAALAVLLAVPAAAAAQDAPPAAAAQDPLAAVPLPAPAVPAPPPISLPLRVPAAQPCPGAHRRSGVRARRIAVGCLVNRARTGHGLRGFAWSPALARAADRHARDMVRRRYLAHRRPGGPSPARRARAAGYRGRDVGEAIAYGCGARATPAAVVRAWLASPPHRAILLSDRSRVGVGVAGRPPVACGGPGATYVLDAGR